MPEIGSVCVYCGSSGRGRAGHLAAARDLGTTLAREGVRLVYGGGRVGLMGAAADAALAAGGDVTGIIPAFLQALELANSRVGQLIVTDTMHSRKQRMAELSDGFVILPGGLGTLDEAFEIVTWRQLGLHDKPIVVLDVDGYWQPLKALLDHILAENYVREDHARLVRFVGRVDQVLPTLRSMPASGSRIDLKWS
ncbi:MAG: TIGR00730 family Rossman fold protein [Alphaproteobacteria bacterium]